MAVFSGIPLTETQPERICGIWVVHTVTGETALLNPRMNHGYHAVGVAAPEVLWSLTE